VMVHIHGGGFLFLSGAIDHTLLAQAGHEVIVSMNYRLSIFGFLAHTALGAHSGDYGLQDVEARAGRAVADLVSAKQLALQVVDGMDHSMFDRVRRADVLDALREVCLAGSAQPLDRYSSG